jgi:prepilin-type N-terminal cleavage/methylation domain-containing protein
MRSPTKKTSVPVLIRVSSLLRTKGPDLVSSLPPSLFIKRDGSGSLSNKIKGFTLIEIISALVILGILCACTLSFLPLLLKKNQMTVIVDDIKHAVQYAKLDALSNLRTVILTPLDEEKNWSTGMILCEDNPNHHCGPEAIRIRQWQWHSPSVRVTWRGMESTNYLRITPTLVNRIASGHFIVKENHGSEMCLVVNRLARVRDGMMIPLLCERCKGP